MRGQRGNEIYRAESTNCTETREIQNITESNECRESEAKKAEGCQMVKTLNESVKHSLNSTAKTIGIKHSSRPSTSELRIALLERLELQIGHLQRAGTGIYESSAKFVGKLKQAIQVVEDRTKAIFHSN
jgi:citrate lyase alpha subunit